MTPVDQSKVTKVSNSEKSWKPEEKEDYDMDVEECPSLVDSEETPKEQKIPPKV